MRACAIAPIAGGRRITTDSNFLKAAISRVTQRNMRTIL